MRMRLLFPVLLFLLLSGRAFAFETLTNIKLDPSAFNFGTITPLQNSSLKLSLIDSRPAGGAALPYTITVTQPFLIAFSGQPTFQTSTSVTGQSTAGTTTQFTVLLPSNLQPGTYNGKATMKVVVQRFPLREVTFPTQPTFTGTVVPPSPDLSVKIIGSPTIQPTATAGQKSITVSFDATSTFAASGACNAQVLIENTVKVNVPLEAIAKGATVHKQATFNTGKTGSKVVSVKIDSGNQVTESNEDNNSTTVTVQL